MLGIYLGHQLGGVISSGAALPVNVSPPSLELVADTLVGVELSIASEGTWSNSPTSYFYQWANTNGDIPSATSNVYTIQVSDLALEIWCRVTAVNGSGASLPVDSDSVTALSAFLTNTVLPVAADDNLGTAPAGLSTTNGSWDSNPPIESYSYKWYFNSILISGATSSTYAASDPGDYYCEVVPSNGQTSGSATSNSVLLS